MLLWSSVYDSRCCSRTRTDITRSSTRATGSRHSTVGRAANPLGQMPQTTGNPLGGMPTTPSGGNPLGGMPLPPAGGNQFGGLPTGTGLPAGGGMPGGNPLGGHAGDSRHAGYASRWLE